MTHGKASARERRAASPLSCLPTSSWDTHNARCAHSATHCAHAMRSSRESFACAARDACAALQESSSASATYFVHAPADCQSLSSVRVRLPACRVWITVIRYTPFAFATASMTMHQDCRNASGSDAERAIFSAQNVCACRVGATVPHRTPGSAKARHHPHGVITPRHPSRCMLIKPAVGVTAIQRPQMTTAPSRPGRTLADKPETQSTQVSGSRGLMPSGGVSQQRWSACDRCAAARRLTGT